MRDRPPNYAEISVRVCPERAAIPKALASKTCRSPSHVDSLEAGLPSVHDKNAETLLHTQLNVVGVSGIVAPTLLHLAIILPVS